MAKVKIQGHASGTGILTVTAPNTSTDRTITLPDATGTLALTTGDDDKLPLAGGILTGDLDISDTGAGALTVGGTTNTYSSKVLFNGADLSLDITDGTKHLASWSSHGGSSHVGSAIGTRSNHDLALVTNDTKAVIIDTSGQVTMPLQPAFFAQATEVTNLAVATTTVPWGTEVFDIGSNFASNTFTAPVTGKYQLNLNLNFNGFDTDNGYIWISLLTSNRNVYLSLASGLQQRADGYAAYSGSQLVDMDASDTCYIQVAVSGGAAQATILASSWFSGFLVC
jgi:hypothetical protein